MTAASASAAGRYLVPQSGYGPFEAVDNPAKGGLVKSIIRKGPCFCLSSSKKKKVGINGNTCNFSVTYRRMAHRQSILLTPQLDIVFWCSSVIATGEVADEETCCAAVGG